MRRRNVLAGLGLSSLLAPWLARAHETEGEHQVEFLFVQSSHGVTLADGKLTLTGVNPSTLVFSDRPERITGHIHTEEFVEDWGEGEDSFAAIPPNAVLSVLDGKDPVEVVVVLREPRLESGNLVYSVEVLDGQDRAEGDAASLFIDTIGRPLTPMSVAGVHRRHRRRRRRRVSRHAGPGPR